MLLMVPAILLFIGGMSVPNSTLQMESEAPSDAPNQQMSRCETEISTIGARHSLGALRFPEARIPVDGISYRDRPSVERTPLVLDARHGTSDYNANQSTIR
jgi:hypothetical protein